MEKPLFENAKTAFTKPYKNLGQMKEIWSKIGKWLPKSLKKHYLGKDSVTRFREVKKPYKTNEKPLFQKSEMAIEKPYKNLSQLKGN